jgi:hypothetical protein
MKRDRRMSMSMFDELRDAEQGRGDFPITGG